MRARTRISVSLFASSIVVLGVAAPASAAPSPTDLVADIVAGSGDGDPYSLTPFNGRLYFVADDGTGADLFVSDGSVGSATNLDLNPTGTSDPYGFTVIGNTLYFAATNGVDGSELWSITGSGAPTMVTDLETGAGNSYPSRYTLFNGDIYFEAFTSTTGQSLFRLSGGTVSQYPMGTIGSPDDFFVYNGYLYFSASGPQSIQLYRVDGTNPPEQFFTTNAPSFGNPHNFAVAGGQLYFLSNDGATAPYSYELYATDGVTTPVKLTNDLADTNGFQYYTVFNDTLYFSAGNAATGRELGYTTGGAVPTYFDINPGAAGSDPEGFTAYNGGLYFSATTPSTGHELFSISGAAAPVLRADIAPGATSGYPFSFVPSNGKLAFSASSTGTSWQLWSFDGTATNQESEIVSPDPDVYEVVALGDYVYFTATSTATGYELWRTRIASAASPALAATGTDPLLPVGAAALLLVAGLALALTRRRVSETQE